MNMSFDVWAKLWDATTSVIVGIWEKFREQEEKKATTLLTQGERA